MVAMTLKNISMFLNLMGHLSGITLVYIIPIIIYNLNESGVSNNKIIINWIIAGSGNFVGIRLTYFFRPLGANPSGKAVKSVKS